MPRSVDLLGELDVRLVPPCKEVTNALLLQSRVELLMEYAPAAAVPSKGKQALLQKGASAPPVRGGAKREAVASARRR
jgi:hypothetical protein